MPTTTTSAGTTVPSARRTPLDPVAAVEALDPHTEAHVDPVVAVDGGDGLADVAAQHPAQRHRAAARRW